MSEEQIKDMILKQCLELTTNNDFRPPISAYDGVDIDDVVRTCKQLQDKKTYLDLVKENQELKKQVESKYEKVGTLTGELLYEENTKLINQQKEFIKWLENGIEQVKNTEFFDERIQRAGLIAYNRCLQKYKEIIGDAR